MITSDKQGRPYAKISELLVGDMVEVDGDFTCIDPWTKHTVAADANGLYIPCSDGRHHVRGQADDGEHCVGIYRVQVKQGVK